MLFRSWGPDFREDHAAAFPKLANPGLNLDIGPMALDYVIENGVSGYFPQRIVARHVARGRLKRSARARKFVYPVYMVYPETRDEEAFEPILDSLRRHAEKLA